MLTITEKIQSRVSVGLRKKGLVLRIDPVGYPKNALLFCSTLHWGPGCVWFFRLYTAAPTAFAKFVFFFYFLRVKKPSIDCFLRPSFRLSFDAMGARTVRKKKKSKFRQKCGVPQTNDNRMTNGLDRFARDY